MAGERSPHDLDIFVDPSNFKEGLEKIFAVIRPKWANIDITKCPGSGAINFTLLVTDGEQTSDGVVVRVFDDIWNTFVKRDREMAATRVFNERGLTPQIYCIFKNGVCMKYIDGQRYNWDSLNAEPLREEKVFKAAAREFAKYHSKKTSDLAIQKFESLLNPSQLEARRIMDDIKTNWPPDFSQDKEMEKLFNDKYPSRSQLIEDWKRIIQALSESGVPIVLCHHDAHPSNSLYVDEEDRLYFVDYETAAFDFATNDLATFLVFSATGLARIKAKPSERHPWALKRMFYREYLEARRKLGDLDHDVTDLDVERLHVQTEKSTLALYMYDSWAGVRISAQQRYHLLPPKGFLQLSCDQMEWVRSHKEEILATKMP